MLLTSTFNSELSLYFIDMKLTSTSSISTYNITITYQIESKILKGGSIINSESRMVELISLKMIQMENLWKPTSQI